MSVILNKKISSRTATIAVVGLGYVGLPLAIAFAQKGYKVHGVDVSRHRIDRLNDRKSYILDITHDEIDKVVSDGKFTAAVDF
ncbi:MAG: NAD(P)-binding domain-containing protein, partial [Candidatus Omnitrophota bacterium]